MHFPATVAPFILLGVTLVGIYSVMAPKADLIDAWISYKRDNEVDHVRLRPTPSEYYLYYDC